MDLRGENRQVRRFLLVLFVCPLLTLALVGVAESQSSVGGRVYRDPAGGNPIVVVGATQDQLKVLDDFMDSKYLEHYHHALLTNDRVALNRMVSDNAVYVAERFGRGEMQDKAQFLAHFGDEKVVHVHAHTRRNVQLRAFGDNTVVLTGISTSRLIYNGKLSSGPRAFGIVYMKLGGRWQLVLHSIMDYKGTL